MDIDPVKEDEAHGVFDDREGERTEKEQHGDHEPADDAAILQQNRHLAGDDLCMRWQHHCNVLLQGVQELLVIDKLREYQQDQRDQGNDGEQGVVGDCPGQQQSLAGAKSPEDLYDETPGMLQDELVLMLHLVPMLLAGPSCYPLLLCLSPSPYGVLCSFLYKDRKGEMPCRVTKAAVTAAR